MLNVVFCSYHAHTHTQSVVVMSDRGGVCVVQGEVSQLLSAIRRGGHWSGHVRTVSQSTSVVFRE